MRKALVIGSLAALAAGGQAMAKDEFSYTHVELGFLQSELDDIDVDGDGFGVRGSLAASELIHVFIEYSDVDYDFGVSGESIEVGGGAHWSLNPRLDLVGTVSFVQMEVDAGGFGSVDDDGFGVGAALRGWVSDQLEVTGGLNYVSFDDAGSDTSFGFGARYYLTETIALGADVDFPEGGNTYALGVRFDF